MILYFKKKIKKQKNKIIYRSIFKIVKFLY